MSLPVEWAANKRIENTSGEARIARANNRAGLARRTKEYFRKKVLDIENRL
jgi:hypothetical protein